MVRERGLFWRLWTVTSIWKHYSILHAPCVERAKLRKLQRVKAANTRTFDVIIENGLSYH
jgi:hypothetical protein